MRLTVAAVAYSLASLQIFSLTTAEPAPSCTSVPSVSSCVASISSVISRTASASKFCSSVLGCPEPTTTTLTGTVTTTSTKTFTESYTFEEGTLAGTVTSSFSYTESTIKYVATFTTRPTWTVERFAVTTIKPKRRFARDIEARAVTSVCPSAAEKNACSCIYTCPGPVTKDNQKTVKVVESETTYDISMTTIPITETEYVGSFTTTTIPVTDTVTKAVIVTNTRTVKCTPSSANPSFYLSATISPEPTPLPFNNKFVQVTPAFDFIHDMLFPLYTRYKDAATLFTLDNKGRLVTPTSYGDRFGSSDNFNSFQLLEFLSRKFVQDREPTWFSYTCTMNPPSGKYAGNYKELRCHGGTWDVSVLQYCPLYVTYFDSGTVIGDELSETTPDCFAVTYLVVPACS